MAYSMNIFTINTEGRLNLASKAYKLHDSIHHCRLVGKVVGKAITQGRYVGIGFSDALCRYLMDRELNQSYLEDLVTSNLREQLQQLFGHLVTDECGHSQCGLLNKEQFQNILKYYKARNVDCNNIINKIGNVALSRADILELRTCLFEYHMYGLKDKNKANLEAIKEGLWSTLDRGIYEKYFTAEDIGLLMNGGSNQ